MVSYVATFIYELSHSLCSSQTTDIAEKWFVFSERKHTAEDKRLSPFKTFQSFIWSKAKDIGQYSPCCKYRCFKTKNAL